VSEAPSIVFAGSSSVEPSSPLPAALAAELALRPSQWVARGIRGSRLAQWTRPSLPSGLRAIVVLLTANDPHPTAAEVRQVDVALRAFAPIVVWLPPLPYPERSRAAGRDALMRAALAGAGVAWVDRSMRIEPARWAPDRVHLTAAGYRDYARQVGAELAVRLSIALDRIGYVHTGRGHRLPLTSVDAVWLARAIVGEGGTEIDAMAIASTMVRRWALLRDAEASSPFRTLTDLVVASPGPTRTRATAVKSSSAATPNRSRSSGATRRTRWRTRGAGTSASCPGTRLSPGAGARSCTCSPVASRWRLGRPSTSRRRTSSPPGSRSTTAGGE
jgi:hypothetical protein